MNRNVPKGNIIEKVRMKYGSKINNNSIYAMIKNKRSKLKLPNFSNQTQHHKQLSDNEKDDNESNESEES